MIIKDKDQEWVIDYVRNLILENVVTQKSIVLKKVTTVSKDLIRKKEELQNLTETNKFLDILEDCFENKLNSEQHNYLIDKMKESGDYDMLGNMLISGINIELPIQEKILNTLISNNCWQELRSVNDYRHNLETSIQEKLDAALLLDKLEKSNPNYKQQSKKKMPTSSKKVYINHKGEVVEEDDDITYDDLFDDDDDWG